MKGTDQNSKHYLEKNGRFVIENYNQSKLFSNFFPGIAGVWGVPMWVFYVNRGQCISSFGIESKDKAMMEFKPANKSFRTTSLHGFRTFLKITKQGKEYFWEPFQNNGLSKPSSEQKMIISSHDLTIEDVNKSLGIKVSVNYFTLANEEYPCLIRQVRLTNLSSKNISGQIVDGLPMIMPYGLKDWAIKNMSRTVEAWVKVENLKSKVPFYRLNVEVNDEPIVTFIREGHFYMSFEQPEKSKAKLLNPIIDSEMIFGSSSSFEIPERFLHEKQWYSKHQNFGNRTPSAMSVGDFNLNAKQVRRYVSAIGYAPELSRLPKIARKITSKGFIEQKVMQNETVIEHIKNCMATGSSSLEFNQYCVQTFLDNVMRGGLPVSLKTKEGDVVFNVFSRKHGDPERDYNYFVLSSTFFSQGNGNYRDVNQNRRNDIWFNVDVKMLNVINFLNLVQADGYNPLVVKGMTFSIESSQQAEGILKKNLKAFDQKLCDMLVNGFQPGECVMYVLQSGIELKVPLQEFMLNILNVCRRQESAIHSEGFWSDHWTYNLDLIESFLSIYPEKLKEALFKFKGFTFFHNSHFIRPRKQRYVLTDRGVRQYHSVGDDPQLTQADKTGSKLRKRNGEGDVYYTTLVTKLLCLIANKSASLDPSGIGVEMEGDKPNWYDSLNGLPALCGSSLSESIELKRFCLFLVNSFIQLNLEENETFSMFEELVDFIVELTEVFEKNNESLVIWNKANDAKEHYRSRILKGIAGDEHILTVHKIKKFLSLVIDRIDQGVERAKDKRNLISTYFVHDVVEHSVIRKNDDGTAQVMPTKFKMHPLPLFLEGFVHLLKVETDRSKASKLYRLIKSSELFDSKLKMYKVCANLSKESEEIGRTRIFPSGWLENESIWTHMEFKYLLELLRGGLYEEFYETLRDVLIPFQDPEVYGRSVLENSSFIVSSAHEDSNLHGRGFVARLSGATAELIHIWLLMHIGPKPFAWDTQRGLTLRLKPALASWLFTKKEQVFEYLDPQDQWRSTAIPPNAYAFLFMGQTLVVYHNPRKKDTFNDLEINRIQLSLDKGKPIVINGEIIPPPFAQEVREGKFHRIDIFFN